VHTNFEYCLLFSFFLKQLLLNGKKVNKIRGGTFPNAKHDYYRIFLFYVLSIPYLHIFSTSLATSSCVNLAVWLRQLFNGIQCIVNHEDELGTAKGDTKCAYPAFKISPVVGCFHMFLN